jgi:hypothetical protein
VFNSPINLPSEFEFELDFTQSASANFVTVMIGETSNDFYYHGFGKYQQLTMAISRNDIRSNLVDDSRTGLVTNTIKIGYDGTQMYCTANNHTITNNNSEFNLEMFLGLLWGGNSTIHSIKIKKL